VRWRQSLARTRDRCLHLCDPLALGEVSGPAFGEPVVLTCEMRKPSFRQLAASAVALPFDSVHPCFSFRKLGTDQTL
jgi:hypothetical protein